MKISVLTPSFNSKDYIERAIVSVLKQDYDNFEHIIMDAGSKDGTVDILKKYDHLNWVSEPDKGQSDAMNKAYKKSTGEIIVFLNADDEFEDGIFNLVIEKFKADPSADMVIGNLRFIWPHNTFIRYPSTKYKDVITYWENLFPQNPVSYFYKREVQEKVGEFPVDLHYTMDYWFLLKAYKFSKVIKVEEVFGNFYNYYDNKTAATENPRLNSHKTVKKYLWNEDRSMIPFFYTKYWIEKIYPTYFKLAPWKKKKKAAEA